MIKRDDTGAPARAQEPLKLAAIQERITLARQLVAIGSSTLRKAQTDFDLATAGLGEIEAELATLARNGGSK